MFLELYVENLALIESVNLQWQPGLNVLTGETGAGKSMVIDAVSLLLGGRASQDYIRKGAALCRVQGTFSPPFQPEVIEQLQMMGLTEEQEDCLFLAREINRNGKTACRINMRPVPLSAFRRLSRLLINIHGQMEHMSLLEPEHQRMLLDSYGDENHRQALQQAAEAYTVWQQKSGELARLQQQDTDREQRQQLLQFQLQEIEAASLKPEEEETLAAEAKILQNAEVLADHARQAWTSLNNEPKPPLESISKALQHLQALVEIDDSSKEALDRLQSLYYELEDITLELRDYKDQIFSDPKRLEEVESRLHQIKGLCKKYGGDVPYLLELAEENRTELEQWENRDERLRQLEQEEHQLAVAYAEKAVILNKQRQQTGARLAEAITQELHDLQMPQATFGVELQQMVAGPLGMDEVVFMIAPNPGEGFKPVAKIASGGEMARIMLSIKVILAKIDAIPTLIFDEIDTGLGGTALISVAEKLTQIARDTQAICVTHAPVLAAYADHNLMVSKLLEEDRTITKVVALNEEQKLKEISRMLAGNHVTETTAQQAKELIACGKVLKTK